MSNSLPLRPTRFWRKKMGPGESSLTHTATKMSTGSTQMTPRKAMRKSSVCLAPMPKRVMTRRPSAVTTVVSAGATSEGREARSPSICIQDSPECRGGVAHVVVRHQGEQRQREQRLRRRRRDGKVLSPIAERGAVERVQVQGNDG